MAWPEIFVSFTIPLLAINIDVMSMFSQSTCSLGILFPKQFIVHMSMPPLVIFSAIMAYVLSNVCGKKVGKQKRNAKTFKIIVVIINLLYPGLCTRIFQMFRCKDIAGVTDGSVLVADFSQRCGQGEHVMFQTLGIVFLCVYVLGIPAGIFCVLKKNRRHLYDENSKIHNEVVYKLGGLYVQYEEKFYWFELVIMGHKMIMTGAMCLVGAGTAAQPMVATLVQLFFLLLVLKLAPYEEDSDDMAGFVASLALTLTLFAAFAISNTDPNNPNFDSDIIGVLLIAISVLCVVFELGLAAYDLELPCCKEKTKFKKMREAERDMKKNTKVVPSSMDRGGNENTREALKDIRLKYGAASEEYRAAAKEIKRENTTSAVADWDSSKMKE